MEQNIRGILNTIDTRIDPATDGVIQSIRDNGILGSPDHITAIAVTAVATSHTITAGYKHLYLINTGSKTVYWGGSGVDSTDGIPINPYGGWWFFNVTSGFKVYLVCAAAESSTIRGVEFAEV